MKVFSSKLDHGVDLMLENGTKIQVKSAHLYHNKHTNGNYYHFSLREWFIGKNSERKRCEHEDFDFYIFWCIEVDSFFIVPFNELGDRSGIDLYPASIGSSANGKTKYPRARSKFNIYKSRWDLLTN